MNVKGEELASNPFHVCVLVGLAQEPTYVAVNHWVTATQCLILLAS